MLIALFVALSSIFTFTSCEKDNITDIVNINEELINQTDSDKDQTDEMLKIKSDETLIVLSIPSIYNNYYSSVFDQIVDYVAEFSSLVTATNKDKIVVLVDAETRPHVQGKIPNDVLLTANIEDIWMRDFSPVIPSKQIKFNYLPDFQDAWTSNLIDNSFEDWFLGNGLKYTKKTNLILDGGNVVDNGGNRVIVTDRFLWDNPQLTKAQAKQKLKNLMGVTQVAIIPELAGDATGHADGMVMFATANKILLHEMPPAKQNQAINELKNAFPGIKIVVVPDYYADETWQGFTSACNIFVNSLVTDKYIYMPTFDSPYDTEMLNLFNANTNKTVVPIPAENVCFMGGSVRCLSWQVKGTNANKILNLLK